MKFTSDICRLQWLLDHTVGKSLFWPLGFILSAEALVLVVG